MRTILGNVVSGAIGGAIVWLLMLATDGNQGSSAVLPMSSAPQEVQPLPETAPLLVGSPPAARRDEGLSSEHVLSRVDALLDKRLKDHEDRLRESLLPDTDESTAVPVEVAHEKPNARDHVRLAELSQRLNLAPSEEDRLKALFHDHVEKLVDILSGDGNRAALVSEIRAARGNRIKQLTLSVRFLGTFKKTREQQELLNQSGRRLLGQERWDRLQREFVVDELDHVGILDVIGRKKPVSTGSTSRKRAW